MKAVVYTRYGPPDVLRLTDVPSPVPKDGEVLVQVHAVSLNASPRSSTAAIGWMRCPKRCGISAKDTP
jgi:hypothetical protein